MMSPAEYAAFTQANSRIRDAIACLFFAAPDLADFDKWMLWREIMRECQFLSEKAREFQLKDVNERKRTL